jgi:hypothetical protein
MNTDSQKNTEIQFAICVNNGGYVDDLKIRTVYQILPDESASRSNYVRVIDETGEDYLYPASLFVFVEVSSEARETLLFISHCASN